MHFLPSVLLSLGVAVSAVSAFSTGPGSPDSSSSSSSSSSSTPSTGKVWNVDVGKTGFTFDPPQIKAAVGDTVQYNFHPKVTFPRQS